MSLNKDRLRYLLKAYMEDTLSKEGFQELGDYILDSDDELQDAIDELWSEVEMHKPLSIASDLMYHRIINDPKVLSDPLVKTIPEFRWKLLGKVAALLCIGFSLFFYLSSDHGINNDSQIVEVGSLPALIVPGSDRAVLTLADGKIIKLDEVNVGDLADQHGVKVVKAEDGSIVYETTPNIESNAVSYNNIKTPNGGQYQLILPDGTKVWLNAASSLHYPTHFTGSQRVVELVGEAYFEVSSLVAENGESMPFIVKSSNQSIEVLGTHFNVNNYDNVAKTTLLEGSVRVSVNNAGIINDSSVVLKPNQQSVVKFGSDQILISTIDPSNAIAWKNGYFAFDREKITDVMSTIARWYDIEVVYEGDVSNKVFGGTLSRFEDIEKLLEAIQLTGSVRFKIEGRRVIVMT